MARRICVWWAWAPAFAAAWFPAIFLGIGLAMLAVELLDVAPTLAVAAGSAAWLRAPRPIAA
jgi:hypothetical protein